MRKIFTLIAACAVSFVAHAQPPIKVSPEIGLTLSSMKQRIGGNDYTTQSQIGFRAGVLVDIPLAERLYLQPGLAASIKQGAQSHYEKFYYTGTGLPVSEHDNRTYDISYFQVPIYLTYKTGKEYDDPKFWVGIGPSFNFATGGRYRQDYKDFLNGRSRPHSKDYSMRIGNVHNYHDIRMFDLSANIALGYELPFGLYFRLQYAHGLLNIAPGGGNHNVFRNYGASFSLGFQFKTSNKPHWQY